MSEESHVTIKIPKDLVDEMDRLKGRHGFRSRGEIAKEAIRKLIFNYKGRYAEPTLEHYNLNEQGVRVLDRSINRIVDVFFKPEGIWCDDCEEGDCIHIQFALSVPKIQTVIRKKREDGWDLPNV